MLEAVGVALLLVEVVNSCDDVNVSVAVADAVAETTALIESELDVGTDEVDV